MVNGEMMVGNKIEAVVWLSDSDGKVEECANNDRSHSMKTKSDFECSITLESETTNF